MDDFSAYLSLCLQSVWLYLLLAPFLIDTIARFFFRRAVRKVDRFFPPAFRKECEVSLIVIGFFLAGYSAFEGERLQRVATEDQRDAALVDQSQTVPTDTTQVDQLQSKVSTLEQKEADLSAQAWPALTDTQIDDWARQLSPFKVTFVSIAYGDETSKPLRDSLAKVFKKAGWPAPLIMIGGGGVGISFKSMEDQAAAPMLDTLFQSICSQVKWDATTDVIAGVQINIGQKPVSNPDDAGYPP